jgi:hypothetical protein
MARLLAPSPAEQKYGADCPKHPLVPRSRFRPQLIPGVRRSEAPQNEPRAAPWSCPAPLRSAEQLNGADILPGGQDSAALRPLVGEPPAARAAPQVGVPLISRLVRLFISCAV